METPSQIDLSNRSAAAFVLHGHFESGNCCKVALMLALCGAGYEYRHVALFDGATRTEDFRRLNRFEEIPVLRHGSRTIRQSGVNARRDTRTRPRDRDRAVA